MLSNLVEMAAGVPVWVWWLGAMAAIALWVWAGAWTGDRIVGRFIDADDDRFGLFMLACFLWPIYWPLRLLTRPVAWLLGWWRGRRRTTNTLTLDRPVGDLTESYTVSAGAMAGCVVRFRDGKPTPYAASAKALGSKVAGQPVTREEFDELVAMHGRMREREIEAGQREANVLDRLAALEAKQPVQREATKQ